MHAQHTLVGEHKIEEVELEGDDEDDDNVEFVIGGNADQSWTQESKVEV